MKAISSYGQPSDRTGIRCFSSRFCVFIRKLVRVIGVVDGVGILRVGWAIIAFFGEVGRRVGG